MQDQVKNESHESVRLSPEQIHEKRVKTAIFLVSLSLIVIGLVWVSLLGYYRAWTYVWIDVAIFIVGLSALILNSRGYIRGAAYSLLINLFVLICTLCIFVDVPTAIVPRSIHNYLLPVAFLTHLILKNEKKWIRNLIFLIYILSFVIFSSTPIGFPLEGIDDGDVRVIGAWLNNVFASGLLCFVIYVLFSDFSLRSKIERELSVAMLSDQFELYYQAQLDTGGETRGAEVLVRWNHPQRGLVAPEEFIPLAEQTGLIILLGQWILYNACRQLAVWAASATTAGLTLAVNVSVQQFSEKDFVENVLRIIKQTGVDTSKLKLELTESLLILDIEEVVEKMTILKSYGVSLSLDDFGTGFSSLNYLKRLPLDQLKIDQSFVRDMFDKPKNAMIVRSVISLGHDLGLIVVAEGVETKQQLDFLLENKCQLFQGFLYSRPVPVKEFEAFAIA